MDTAIVLTAHQQLNVLNRLWAEKKKWFSKPFDHNQIVRLIVYKQWIKASRRFESRKMVKLDVIQTSVISALTPYFSQIYKWNTRSFHLEGCLTTSFNLCTIVSKWLAFVFDTMRVLLEISRFCFVFCPHISLHCSKESNLFSFPRQL